MGAHKREGTLASTGHAAAVDDIVARLERLPTSWWQVKARIIVGVATFFEPSTRWRSLPCCR
jgi:hypothetical protein